MAKRRKQKGRKKGFKAQVWNPDLKKPITVGWFETKDEAIKAEQDYKAEIRNQVDRKTNTLISFPELCAEKLHQLESEGASKVHFSAFRSAAKRWCTWKDWKDRLAKDISPAMIRDYRDFRAEPKPDPCYPSGKKMIGGITAANRDIKLIRAVYSYGIKMGYLADNPAIAIDVIPWSPKEISDIQPETLKSCLEATRCQEDKDYILLLIHTGARPVEIHRAKFSDIDWENKTLALSSMKSKGRVKKTRIIQLNETSFSILERRKSKIDQRNTEGFIFWHSKATTKFVDGKKIKYEYQGPYKQRKRLIAGVTKRAGVEPFRLYDLRHTAATLIANQIGSGQDDISLKDAMEITGHQRIETFMRYFHGSVEKKKQAMRTLEEKLK